MKNHKAISFTVGWLRLVEGLAMILTLGNWTPMLEMRWLVANHLKEMKRDYLCQR